MNGTAIEIASKFISGDIDNESNTSSDLISELESLNPDFLILENMITSKSDIAKEAALYILYNRDGPFPENIMKLIHVYSSHPSKEIRLWAKACID